VSEAGPGPDLAAWTHEVVLADGGTAFLRPVRESDAEALADLHARLSPRSRYLRYFSGRRRLPPREIARATHVDYKDRMAFAAFSEGRLIGFARYDRRAADAAPEVAFQIEDAEQGRGLGTLLLEHLAAYAREQGFDRLAATVLPENRKMLEVFRNAGFPKTSHFEQGLIEVSLEIDPTRHSREAIEARHRHALEERAQRAAGEAPEREGL
jgi:RimJ/RimL family protein N-acetyltransferase